MKLVGSTGLRLFSKYKMGYWTKSLASCKYAEAPLPSAHFQSDASLGRGWVYTQLVSQQSYQFVENPDTSGQLVFPRKINMPEN